MTRLDELRGILDDRPLDPVEGYDTDRGLEGCVLCGKLFSGNGLYWGPVYDQTGRYYESVGESDPRDGPFFCAACWPHIAPNALERSRRERNMALADFVGGDE